MRRSVMAWVRSKFLVRVVAAVFVATAAQVVVAPSPAAASTCTTPNEIAGWFAPVRTYVCEFGISGVVFEGRLHQFVVTPNLVVSHIWQQSVNGPWTPYWVGLGGESVDEVELYLHTVSGRQYLKVRIQEHYYGNYRCKFYNLTPGVWTPSQNSAWGSC